MFDFSVVFDPYLITFLSLHPSLHQIVVTDVQVHNLEKIPVFPSLVNFGFISLPDQHVLEMEAKMDQLRAMVEAADREKVELLNQLEEEKR